MNIFIKESSCNLTTNLCICIWNLTKWRAASSFFWSLNFGRPVCQSTLGIQFGKPGMWAWFIGAYLAEKGIISTNEYTESILQTLQSFDSGVAIGILKTGFLEDGVTRWNMHNLADI